MRGGGGEVKREGEGRGTGEGGRRDGGERGEEKQSSKVPQ